MSEQNRALTLRWMQEVWNDRRDETIEELLDPKAVGYFEGLGTIGVDGFKAGRKTLLDTFPDLQITVEDTVCQGDHVVSRWLVKATHSGATAELPASGKAVEFRGLTWMIIRDGKIVRGWDAWNQGGLLSELIEAVAKSRES